MSVFMVQNPFADNGPPIEHSSDSSLFPGFLAQSGISNFLIRTSIPAPVGLAFTQSGTTLVANWTTYTGAINYTYTVYSNSVYATPGTAVAGATGSVGTNTFTFSSPVSGTYYYFSLNVTTSVGTSQLNSSGIVQYVTNIPVTPLTISSNVALWMDAADATSMTLSGSTVTRWNDKSSNATSFIAASGWTAPTIQANAQNGKSSVNFNGTTNILRGVNVSPDGRTAMTMFLVAYQPSGTSLTAGSIFSYNQQAGWSSTGLAIYQGGIGWRYGTGQPQNPSVVTTIGANYAIAMVNKNGVTETGWVNGTQVYSNSSTLATLAGNSNEIWIGYGVQGFLNENVGEIISVFSNLSSTPQTQMEGYLAWKWGLQSNLPINHPYRYSEPTITPGTPTNPTLAIATGNGSLSWSAAAGATSYAWTLYNNGSNTSDYVGVVGTNGTTTAPTVSTTVSGLQEGSNYYYTVSASNASGVSPVVASPIVKYFPNPYNLTLAVTSSNATLAWLATGTSPTFTYTLFQTTVNAYTGGSTTTIAGPTTTGLSNATVTFSPVSSNYYYYTINETTPAFSGVSPTYNSPIAAIPLSYSVSNAILGLDYTVLTTATNTYIAFLNSEKSMSLTTTVPATISYVVMGGGGSGSSGTGGAGSGGGGAGAIQSNASYLLSQGTQPITVGRGGGYLTATPGSNTVFGTVVTAAGGSNGTNGSGGVGGRSGTPPGNVGGNSFSSGDSGVGGGGGGVGGTGVSATSTQGGNGGAGVTVNFGTSYNIGGGGGGGAWTNQSRTPGTGSYGGGNGNGGTYTTGIYATPNTGGGGGGGGNAGSSAGPGGSGIILLSFPVPLLPAPSNPNITFSNSSGSIYTIATAWTAVPTASGYSYSLVNTTTATTLASGTTVLTSFSLAGQTIGSDTITLTVNAYNANGSGVPATASAFHSVSPSITVGNATLGTDYTTSNVGGVPYYAFLATGKTMSVTTTAATTISIVAIGGGGAGGGNIGGGAGAGGCAQTWNYSLPAGVYSIVIGAGASGTTQTAGSNGSNTVFGGSVLTAYGGGGGGKGAVGITGGCGGSGAAGAGSYSIGGLGIQGYNGGASININGNFGPGGGGIGGPGGNCTGSPAGSGGVGLAFTFGSTTYNLGGGGGGWSGGTASFGGGAGAGTYGNGANGGANTGGGGGAGGAADGGGGNGGSGILLIAFN
jgi:hypothetical protein